MDVVSNFKDVQGGKTAKLIYHVTRSGNRVIDYIRDVK